MMIKWPWHARPLIPEQSAYMLLDMYAWALRQFDQSYLVTQSISVPNSEFFLIKSVARRKKQNIFFNKPLSMPA